MPFAIGERIGDYEVVKVLGAGGMGEVYKVRHVISDRVEAMKVLLPNLEGDAELVDRFLREIKVQASLSHPNIASLFTAVKHGNKLLMLMEFVEGCSIEEKLRAGPLAAELGVRYVAQVLDALAYAHSKGVVHRDIKPANIMVTGDGVVKLMDFGIARMKQDRKLTNTGQTVGSLFYMSPEQIRGEELDARSDLYSLGVTLYEVVTGKRPFEGTSDYSIMAAHLQQNPVPPIQVDARVPQRLNEIILTAIAKEREKRFQKAEAFGAALRNSLAEFGIQPPPAPAAAKPPEVVTRPAAAPAWGRYAAIAAGVLFIGLAASQIPKWRSAEPVAPANTALEPVSAHVPAEASVPAEPPARAQTPTAPAPAAPVAKAPPEIIQRNLPEPIAPTSKSEAVTVTASAPVTAAAPTAAVLAPAATNTEQLEALRDRMMKLGVRVGAIGSKARSLEQQQAVQGVGMRGDVKSDQSLTGYLMDEAEQRLHSGNAGGAKSSLDKAEHLVEKLERILGL